MLGLALDVGKLFLRTFNPVAHHQRPTHYHIPESIHFAEELVSFFELEDGHCIRIELSHLALCVQKVLDGRHVL